MIYQKEMVIARRIWLHHCSEPLIVNHLYYLFSVKSHELSKSILITDKTRKNSTAGAITSVQMLGLGGGGNQVWSGTGLPLLFQNKIQGHFKVFSRFWEKIQGSYWTIAVDPIRVLYDSFEPIDRWLGWTGHIRENILNKTNQSRYSRIST